MSQSSTSTTQQTGLIYTSGFSKGFIAKNRKIMENGSWFAIDFKVYGQVKKDNKIQRNEIGDIDFICRIIEAVNVRDLFPATSRSKDEVIPKDSLLLFELTSMSGEHAMSIIDKKTNMTKIDHKLRMYNTLFETNNKNLLKSSGVDVSEFSKCFVLFVYNGMDYVDIQNRFVSDKFNAIVVHLPQVECINWSVSVDVEEANDRADRSESKLKEKEDELKKKEDELKEKEDELKAVEKVKVDMILRMKGKNMSIKEIAEIVNVTEDFIASLCS